MNIFSNTVVTLTYKLFSASGELIEESTQPITYLHGGHHGIFPKVEAALAQKRLVGTRSRSRLEPEDAFGDYDADLVRIESQDRFPTRGQGGNAIRRAGRTATIRMASSYTVTDIAEGKVVVDGNHQLAGQRLRLRLHGARRASGDRRKSSRTATSHGAHGHHH